MPMMNSEARKRVDSSAASADPVLVAARLADDWDREADQAEAAGNGFAAVILHAVYNSLLFKPVFATLGILMLLPPLVLKTERLTVAGRLEPAEVVQVHAVGLPRRERRDI